MENRLEEKVPIIDEVAGIQKLPDDVLAAIEVALPGQTIRMLSNPYGIATLLGLDAEQTRMITPIAKSLIGKRSAVVLKTPGGNIRENLLPAGKICLHADQDAVVDLDEGAEKIMQVVSDAGTIYDMEGEHDTNVGNMFSRIKQGMENLDETAKREIHITDILAVDTMAPVRISGALAGETCLEKSGRNRGDGKDEASSDAEDCRTITDRTGCKRDGGRRGSGYGQSRSPDDSRNKPSACNSGYGRRFYGCSGDFRGWKGIYDASGRCGRACVHADRDRAWSGRPAHGRAD